MVYAIPGWGFCSSIFNSLNREELNLIGLNYLNAPLTSLESIAQYLVTQLPDRAVLLGWSFGGLIAIELAALFPEKVKKLILMSSQAKLVSDNDWTGIDRSNADNFAEAWMKNPAQQMEQFISLISYPSRSLMLRSTLRKYLFSQYTAQLTLLLTLLLDADLRNQYQKLDVDVLHIVNSRDVVIPQNVAQIKGLKPNASVEEFKNTGHAGFLTESDRYADVISHFSKQGSANER